MVEVVGQGLGVKCHDSSEYLHFAAFLQEGGKLPSTQVHPVLEN